jgi:hypothetical protein
MEFLDGITLKHRIGGKSLEIGTVTVEEHMTSSGQRRTR